MGYGYRLLALLIGHMAADFYLQSGRMAQAKRDHAGDMFAHCVIYAFCMAVVSTMLFTADAIVPACATLACSHAAADVLKALWGRKHKESMQSFVIDQSFHVLACVLVAAVFPGDVPLLAAPALMEAPSICEAFGEGMIVVAIALAIMRPASVCVTKTLGMLRSDSRKNRGEKRAESDSRMNAGRVIGYLERAIIVILVRCNQASGVGFVLAAKSVARFKELEGDREFAEVYLIGTLMSTAIALGVPLLFEKIARL